MAHLLPNEVFWGGNVLHEGSLLNYGRAHFKVKALNYKTMTKQTRSARLITWMLHTY